eukprot:scaffold197426_cov40-Cyclotella_meneghiniana.AAC.3
MWGIGAETQKVSDDSGAATTIFMSQLLGTTETTLSWDKILPAGIDACGGLSPFNRRQNLVSK